MSLETSLELNNQLLAQHNALLERLIRTMASGIVMHPDTISRVQECRDTATETENMSAAMTLDDLEFSDVIALAGFYPVATPITEDMLQRAVAYRDAEGDKRVVQIDALDSALQGVKRARRCLNQLSWTCPVTSLSSGTTCQPSASGVLLPSSYLMHLRMGVMKLSRKRPVTKMENARGRFTSKMYPAQQPVNSTPYAS